MTSTVILEISLKPDEIDSAIALFKESLPDTRAYDGCQSIEVIQGDDDPTCLIVYEKWESRSHYEKYLAWREETGFLDKLGAFLAGPPKITYLNSVDA